MSEFMSAMTDVDDARSVAAEQQQQQEQQQQAGEGQQAAPPARRTSRLKKSHSSGSIARYKSGRALRLFESEDEDEKPAENSGATIAPEDKAPDADEALEAKGVAAYAGAKNAVAVVETLHVPRIRSVDSLPPNTFLGAGVVTSPYTTSGEDAEAATPGNTSQASSGVDETSTEEDDCASSRRSDKSGVLPELMNKNTLLDGRLQREQARQRLGASKGANTSRRRLATTSYSAGSYIGASSLGFRLDDEDEESDFDVGYESSASPNLGGAQPPSMTQVLGGPHMFDFDVMKRKTRLKQSKKLDRPSMRKGQTMFVRVALFPVYYPYWKTKLGTALASFSLGAYLMQVTSVYLYLQAPEEPSEVMRFEIMATLLLFFMVAGTLSHCAAVSKAVDDALAKEMNIVDATFPIKSLQRAMADISRDHTGLNISSDDYPQPRPRLRRGQSAEQPQGRRDQNTRRERLVGQGSTIFTDSSVKLVDNADDYDEDEDDSISSDDEDDQTDFDEGRLSGQAGDPLKRPSSQNSLRSIKSAGPTLGSGGIRDKKTAENGEALSPGDGRSGQRVRIQLGTRERDTWPASFKSTASSRSQPAQTGSRSRLPSPPRLPELLGTGHGRGDSGSVRNPRRERDLIKTSSVHSLLWSNDGPRESTLHVEEVRHRILDRVYRSKANLKYEWFGNVSALVLAGLPTLYRCAVSFLPVLCWFAEQPASESFMALGGLDDFLQNSVCRPAFMPANATNETATGVADLSADPLVCYIADQDSCDHTVLEAVVAAVGRAYDPRAIFVSVTSAVTAYYLLWVFFHYTNIAEGSFRRRLLYAKHFGKLTSSRRAQKAQLPHFRLNRVNHIRVWLELRNNSGESADPNYKIGDASANALVVVTLTIVAHVCLRLFSGAWSFQRLDDWAALLFSTSLTVFMYRLMNLASATQKKYNTCARVLYTEQLNIYIQLFANPVNKDELVACNNMLKIAIKLLASEGKPGKDGYKAILLNPVVYNLFRVTILSAMGTMSSDVLGFKVRLWKI